MAGPGCLVVVVGDLAVDVHVGVPSSSLLEPLHEGGDVIVYAEAGVSVGGSAWQHAQALTVHPGLEPVVFAAVGDDPAGGLVRDALRRAGLRLDGVATVPGARTSVSSMTYFEHGQRLMVCTARHANHALTAVGVTGVLGSLRPERVACTWLSGHALLDRCSERWAATTAVCGWARRHGVPLVLDLVPHDFGAAVGDLAEVERLVGHVDGLVGELGTFRRLGYPAAARPGTGGDRGDGRDGRDGWEAREVMAAVAGDLGRHHRFVAVQHRERDAYLQVVSDDGRVAPAMAYDVAARGLRGLGDAMAIDALIGAGILPALSPAPSPASGPAREGATR